ncbi:SDR family NAD(P)-dependent oxidoreductase [Micromonospora sp. NPDC048898]|uniref:SDR family NAD(P)-dependent oxidoreductase n=1 Tax=Micromonospora sp. NPDC048898 TaxID=3364260 RepID=UPI00371BFE64
MSPAPNTRDLVIAISAGSLLEPSPGIVTAARHGGGHGVLDLAAGDNWTLTALAQATAGSSEPIGVRVPAGCTATQADVDRAGHGMVDLVVVPLDTPWQLADLVDRYRVLVEVTSLDDARLAVAAGAHGLIARGMEGGGKVSELSSFVLLQQLAAADGIDLPIWVAGGIGPRTAVACVIGGAAGVVLDSQLALMPESELPADVRGAIRRLDGSETVLVDGVRGIRRGGPHDSASQLLPIGQDGWLAAVFARRWPDTAAAVRGIRATLLEAIVEPAAGDALVPGAALADALNVRIPVVQGPMTRVSDEAPFAAAVAADGALPFIALALSGAEQSRRVLRETADRLGDRPWGVGVLGFAPDELRAAQLEAIREIRPACAIIAGGRPSQATELERDGINTFLHVPSPGLLRQFLRAGARKFVFEGAECGGHVGPRASFPLWEAQLLVLEEFLANTPDDAGRLQLLFAGGIHDARSAAMVAAMAAPLTGRGAQIGLLMGTAYLFTREAVQEGAIQPLFHRTAIAATGTSLLETAPGHATRCLPSPFVDDFHGVREELESAGVEDRQVWEQLELLNVGRLRIASKGVRREDDGLVEVDEAVQAVEGMFMAGQVAVLRHAPTTVAELHAQVTTEAREFHAVRTAALRAELTPPAVPVDEPPAPLDIAIVGMSCVLPGSPDLHSFWQTVLGGTDAVTEVPADRWDVDTYYAPEVGPGQAGRISVSRWGGFIEPVPFDAIRYGIPPAALSSIDPTQLLALEVAHRALVDAGYPYDAADADHSQTGVVFGAEAGSDMGHAQTLRTMLPAYLGDVPAELEAQLPTVTEDSFPGVLANVIAGRVANRLDLGGPNYTIDAACASSLAAMDAACKELSAGSSDLMICGGADLHNGINDYLMFTSAHALSPTGRCRTFDSTGDGIALGEGVACVVLKRLADAERDGDRIYAVIKGVGSSSDGRALGLTAPRASGQRRALDRAYHRTGISPREIGLVEAHGTGTVVGDRTELETLTRFFDEAGAEPGSCALGSVKSQIGHTKCAAGLVGVIKASLALYTGVKPPTIHLTRPNPAWSPERSPFAFYTSARPWAAPAAERLAGVSAFGFGGTNFHAVLSAHPNGLEPRHTRQSWPAELFCFRGADRPAAQLRVRRLVEMLSNRDELGRPWSLRDLAASLSDEADHRAGAVRIAIVARDRDELAKLLDRALAGEHDPTRGLVQPPDEPGPGKVAFLFPGQGSQRPGALAELFVAFPELRHYLRLGAEWADLLFPPSAFDPEAAREQEDRVRDTRVAQPVLGIGGLAVDHLLRRLGVRPDLTGGHSYGELVALCVADAFDPETLLALSRQRAEAILAATGDDPGTMAAVTASAEQVDRVLTEAGLAGEVVLANRNAPTQVVISGPTPAVGSAVSALREAGLSARGLSVACAFHSPVVAAGTTRFAEALAARTVREPAIPVWSNQTAAPYDGDADRVREQLAAQIGAPVRFVEQIESMYASGARTFVEAGPGQVLTKLVRAVLGDRPHLAVAAEPRPEEGLRGFLVTVAQLACAGVPVRTGWLFQGRDAADLAAVKTTQRPFWTIDGQLVRDQFGNSLPGGMTPPRRIKELSMTASNGTTFGGRDGRDELLSEFLRTSRDMIASQRDVMLAYFGDGVGGRLVWQPTQPYPPVVLPGHESEVAQVTTTVVAAAPPAAPAVAVDVTAVPVAASGPDFQTAILEVISERTGYPVDLIELDLDLEADLSIDSIKRAEVAGEVAARLRLAVEGDEAELEDLVKARTVRTMVEWLNQKMRSTTSTTVIHATAVLGPANGSASGSASGSAHSNTLVATSTVVLTRPDFQTAILEVISERTGYPVDLIELDLDLEADLSIDSIKRAEVAGEVAARLRLAVEGDEAELEDLVKARTVRTMVDWLNQKMQGQAVGAPSAGNGTLTPPVPLALTTAAPAPMTAPSAGAPSALATMSPAIAPAPIPTAPAPIAFVADTAAVAAEVTAAGRVGITPKRLLPQPGVIAGPPGADSGSTLAGTSFLITGASPALAYLAELLREHGAGGQTGVVDGTEADQLAGFDGLILLDGLTGAGAPLLPEIFPFLKQALATGPRWLLAAGPVGGTDRTDGLAGLFRTIAREYPQVTVRYVEVDAAADPQLIARHLLDELLVGGDAPVVARGETERTAVDLAPVPLGAVATSGAGPAGDGASEAAAIGLDRDSVVVLVGGARGITPWFARTVAMASRCRIELVGRTPLPTEPEDPDLVSARDKASLRAALARRGMRSPAEIERTAQAVLAAREVEATLTELRELGSEVRYHALDVRDASATRGLLLDVERTHGRVDGVVYAAGMIEDKLIAEKDPQSFARVFGTKVDGARSVLAGIDELGSAPRFVVLFGSIAAAYGNRGQGDYAAANDAIDAIGTRWADATGNRCLTVHWGPWAPGAGHGGMVTDELSREYARRGIELIDPEAGAFSLLSELAWGDPKINSVVYTASGW